MKAKRIISLGAGVQSSALALMAARGDIPPVDAAIFADTQDEPVKVYEWLQWLISEIEKSPFPFPVHIVTEGKLSDKALIMRTTKDGRKFSSSDIPVFTKAADGTVGKIRSRACTRDFKLVPIFRKAKEIVGSEGMKAWRRQYRPQLREWAVYQKELVAYRKAEGASDDLRKTLEKDAANGCETSARALEELLKNEKRPSPKRPTGAWDLMQENALVEQLIGISTDEIQRMKPSRDAYFRSAWPLIDLGLNREACIKYVQKLTGKTPPRSACHMCPYHNNNEWLRLKTEEPEAFNRAVEFEKELQRVKSRTDNFGSTPFLHRTCLPIDQVPFEELIAAKEAKAARKNAQMSFEFGSFTEECLGLCGL